jgi:hypothetical protein
MNIYTRNKPVLPYVYRCTEKDTGKFYIGYRYKNRLPASEDFGKHYFTSNEYVKNNLKYLLNFLIGKVHLLSKHN